MLRQELIENLKKLTQHEELEIVLRGNSAITSALSILPKESTILIPAEGGWLHYKLGPKKLNLAVEEVRCEDARIDLKDLRYKLSTKPYAAFLYQNPGGYFAEQPTEEIYKLCHQHNCLVILDVSGALGTELCTGQFADILIASFGEGKLVEAKVGGFVSAQDWKLWEQLRPHLEKLENKDDLQRIREKLRELPTRIHYLEELQMKVIHDLRAMRQDVVHPADIGFVVVAKFQKPAEKEKIINYCQENKLEWTECPRYIRLNQPAISIEIKKLEQ